MTNTYSIYSNMRLSAEYIPGSV